jgi:hypothetical protein
MNGPAKWGKALDDLERKALELAQAVAATPADVDHAAQVLATQVAARLKRRKRR